MKKTLFLILFLTSQCFGAVGDRELKVDGAKWIWNNNSQTFSIAASGSMSESVDYLWPPVDGSSGQAIITDGAGGLSFTSPSGFVHNLLSVTHSDTTTDAVTRGSLIYGNSDPNWDELVIGAATYYLRSDGTDLAWNELAIVHDLSPQLGGDLSGQQLYDLDHIVDINGSGDLTMGDDITAGDSFFASLGLVGSPSYSFTGNTTSGMFLGSQGVKIVRSGNLVAEFGDSGSGYDIDFYSPFDMKSNSISGVDDFTLAGSIIGLEDGSAGTPAIRGGQDPETGIYFDLTGLRINLSSDGTRVFWIDDTAADFNVPVDLGTNALTVNSNEIVGADGEVNKNVVEDSDEWDTAYDERGSQIAGLNLTWNGSELDVNESNSANWDAAYTHSQDHTQAHTDYLINDGNDTTSGVLTAGGFVTAAADDAIDVSGAGSAGLTTMLKLSTKSLGAVELGSAIDSGFNKAGANEYFNLIGSSSGSTIFGGGVDGDDYRRFRIKADGTVVWGSGSAATDVDLYRIGANILGTHDSFYVYGGLLFTERHVLDDTHAEAFLVRKDGDGGDVFTVNTTSSIVTVGGTLNVTGNASVGDDTNDTVISTKGVLTMTGDARVIIGEDIDLSIPKRPVANPPAEGTEAAFPTLDFDDGTDESIFVVYHLKEYYASAGAFRTHVDFFVDTAPVGDANVVWGVEYQKLSHGDNFNFSATATLTTTEAVKTGTPANDKQIHETSDFTLTTTGWEPHDIILLRFYRDADNGNDNFADDARLMHIHIDFLSDKLGEAL